MGCILHKICPKKYQEDDKSQSLLNNIQNFHEDNIQDEQIQYSQQQEQYAQIKLIGSSVSSKVYLVQRLCDQKYFAMKSIRKQDAAQIHLEARINTELTILKMCDSPFIVKLIETYQSNERLYFIMEFIQGGELYALIRKQKLKELEARFYVVEIICALHYLHEKNIIYRDLNPENILISKDGHIKLVDFTYSHIGSQCRDTSGVIAYQAPEIIKIDGHSFSGDMWALGAIFYEILIGTVPHFNKDPKTLKLLRLKGKLDFPAEISFQAKDLISSLLVNDPALRLWKYEDVIAHPFFNGIDWQQAQNQELEAIFIPDLENEGDITYFKNQAQSIQNSEAFGGNKFNNFTFQNQNEVGQIIKN